MCYSCGNKTTVSSLLVCVSVIKIEPFSRMVKQLQLWIDPIISRIKVEPLSRLVQKLTIFIDLKVSAINTEPLSLRSNN